MFIDTHCHLTMKEYAADREEVIRRAVDAGVTHLVCVGYDLPSSIASVELAHKHPEVYATVGIHPHDARTATEEALVKIRALSESEKVVAIGETGLDFYRNLSPRQAQEASLRAQIGLANEFDLPLIVHDREAHDEVLKILEEEQASRAVLHCFPGDLSLAREVTARGYLISFGGPITYEKNGSGRLSRIVEELPLEKVMLETDAPYLTPVPHRGERNEPAYIPLIAERVARAAKLTVADVARVTTHTARAFFGIGEPDPAKIAYEIRSSLYLNLTNRCTNDCTFCARQSNPVVKGHNLRLERDPTAGELLAAIGDPSKYEEVVFCGYGEPIMKLQVLKDVANALKPKGVKLRLDTNGTGSLIHRRNVLPELAGLLDSVSVSLNAQDAKTYLKLCPNVYGEKAFPAILEFIREARKCIPEVTATVVEIPGLDVEACRKLAEKELGVKFRIRKYNIVG
jgi:TatD DNase family protein